MSAAIDLSIAPMKEPPGDPSAPGHVPASVLQLPQRRARFGIRWIVVATAAALITAAVLGVGWVSERTTREALTREIEARLLLQGRSLALAGGEALLSDFPELTLHPLARELKKRQSELALVVLVDRNNKIQGEPDPGRINQVFSFDQPMRPVPAHQTLDAGEEMLTDGRILVASVPVSHRDGRRMGTALVGLPLRYVEQVIERSRRQQFLVLAVVLLLGIAAAGGIMSFVLRPVGMLRAGIERIGRGDLETPLPVRDRTEFGILAEAVNRMAAQLKSAQSVMVERERLARELELARQIQASLLPNSRATAGPFTIHGSNRAAQEVGGDLYDYFELPDGRVGLAIADVSGKGLAGCMVMSMLSALLRAYREADPSPAAVLATLDARLGETLQRGSFVTMFYGVLDPATGELVFANAGHSPLLVYRNATRGVEWHRTRGIPLGAIRNGAIRKTLEDKTIMLAPGDLLVQFTDGVNEAFDPAGSEQFGFDRLEQKVVETGSVNTEAILAAVHHAVEDWSGSGPPLDDETLLVVTRDGASVAAASDGDSGASGEWTIENGVPTKADFEALDLLERARTQGRHLALPATTDSLALLREWIHADEAVARYTRPQFEVLVTALYEACANVVEHGCGNDAAKKFEVWSVPGTSSRGTGAIRDTAPRNAPAGGAVSGEDLHPLLADGFFLLRDPGIPFRARGWKATDFSDRSVWKRGRGFGLDIIHRGMNLVSYHPSTREGNLMVMAFHPLQFHPPKEARNG